MPSVLAPFVCALCGALLAWLAPPSRTSRLPSRTALLGVASFCALVLVPAHAYSLIMAPAWSYAYAVDPDRIPSALELCLLGLDVLVCCVAFALTRRLERKGQATKLVATACGLSLAGGLAAWLVADRLAVVGPYDAYAQRLGLVPFAGSAMAYAGLWIAVLVALGMVVTTRWLRRDTR